MKKLLKINLAVLAATSLFSALTFSIVASAQDYNDGLKEELNQEIDQMYPKRKSAHKPAVRKVVAADSNTAGDEMRVDVQPVRNDQIRAAAPAPVAAPQYQAAAPIAQAPANNVQPIYILQQPPASMPQAQVQPITNVEASAVRESRAEQLRKQREEIEHQNEMKLIERLEDERLNAEKERMDKILVPATATAPAPVAAPVAPVAPVVAPVAVQTPPAAPIAVVAAPEAVSVVQSPIEELKVIERTRVTMGGLVGVGAYPTVNNVNGAYAAGLQGGLDVGSGVSLNMTGIYSSYDVARPICGGCFYGSPITRLTQYNILMGSEYRFLSGKISPTAGAFIGYTRRSYTDPVNYGYGSSASRGSNAFDAGLSAGADFRISRSFSVGGDVKYLFNISYRTDDVYAYSSYYPTLGTPLESLNYYFVSINLKFVF